MAHTYIKRCYRFYICDVLTLTDFTNLHFLLFSFKNGNKRGQKESPAKMLYSHQQLTVQEWIRSCTFGAFLNATYIF